MIRGLIERLPGMLATGFMVAAMTVISTPAEAQEDGGRLEVLIPDLQAEQGADEDFGEDVADRLRDLIDDMNTHAPVGDRAVREVLRQYDLDEDEMTCIQWRQLGGRNAMNVPLVMCGTYAPSGGQTTVTATFSAQTGGDFTVDQFSAGSPDEAANHIFTEFESYVRQLSLASNCVEYLRSDQWDRALENCNNALELNPEFVTALYGRGEALMRKAEELVGEENGGPLDADQDEAGAPVTAEEVAGEIEGTAGTEPVGEIDELGGEAVTEQPDDEEEELPAEYIELMEQSLESFEAVLDVTGTHMNALVSAGYVAAQLGQPEKAREYYSQLLELDPENSAVRLQRAADLFQAGDPLGALQLARAGIELDSSHVELQEYAGHFAMQAAQQIAEEDPDSATALRAQALENYMFVFEERGEEAQPVMLRNMIAVLGILDRDQEAVELGERALEVHGENPGLWLVYADALNRSDRTADAIEALDSVASLDPDVSGISARQGQWLLDSDETARAREVFEEAVERGELTGDEVADRIFAYGYREKQQQGQPMEAMDYFELSREFATSAELRARASFFMGYNLFQRGNAVQEPSTAESARRALPIFQEAMNHLQNATAYTEQASVLQELIDNTERFIEIQELLIQRGS